MDEELERLRAVARALIVEREAHSISLEMSKEWHGGGIPPTAEYFRRLDAHKECKRVLDAALASLTEATPASVGHMDDERDRLRNLVRTLAAEAQTWSAFHEFMNERRKIGMPPTEESISEARRVTGLHTICETAVVKALARLAEVPPGLVAQQS
jgi:hypothetical protein